MLVGLGVEVGVSSLSSKRFSINSSILPLNTMPSPNNPAHSAKPPPSATTYFAFPAPSCVLTAGELKAAVLAFSKAIIAALEVIVSGFNFPPEPELPLISYERLEYSRASCFNLSTNSSGAKLKSKIPFLVKIPIILDSGLDFGSCIRGGPNSLTVPRYLQGPFFSLPSLGLNRLVNARFCLLFSSHLSSRVFLPIII